MTLQDLQVLLDYHYWARDRMLDGLDTLTPEQFTRDLGSSFRSIRDTAAHLYGAEVNWYKRWQGEAPTTLVPADQFPDPPTLRRAWAEHEQKVRAFVDGLGEEGVSRVFDYQMLNGVPGSSPFWQMVHHLVNHGSYHRGQVTTMLRQVGAEPAQSMDAIRYYRTRK